MLQRVQQLFFYLGASICLSLVGSCERDYCFDSRISAWFRGFDSTELSYVIVEHYQKGTSFATLDNRKVYGTAIVNATEDSLLFDKAGASLTIDNRFDTYVRVINANKEYRIRDISNKREKTPRRTNPFAGEMEPCANTVSGFLNDVKFEGKAKPYANGMIPMSIDLNK